MSVSEPARVVEVLADHVHVGRMRRLPNAHDLQR